jgi:EthD domain
MRVQLLFAARGGCTDALFDRLDDEGKRAKASFPTARVIALTQVANDQFPLANPLCRPFESVLELQTPAADDGDTLVSSLGTSVDRLADLIHRDLSGVLVGIPHEIIPTSPTAVRYLYLMRRKSTHTREQYFDYYFNNHSRFGHRTPGIVGYTQFHVDDVRSRAAASALGVGTWGADSVSELHLNSVDEFFAALATAPTLGDEAGADEETFVDRTNSKSFTTDTRFVL